MLPRAVLPNVRSDDPEVALMNISYLEPLRRAWARMVRMLFRPFRGEVWFVLGFAAFLSEYLSWGFSGSRSGFHMHRHAEFPHAALVKLVEFLSNPFAVALILWIVIAALAIAVLFTWISSRGMFIFLDNVAHERRGIVEPWRRFKRLGNSLFLWRLGFHVVFLLAVGAILFSALPSLVALARTENPDITQLLTLLPLFLMMLPVALAIMYVQLLLTSFVVPIMYRHDLSVTAAWSRFLQLFSQHLMSFILYGLFVLVLGMFVGAAVVGFGFATCCIGFLLLSLPYIGSVVLLPIEVTARAFGPEFLAQFGPEYAALAPAATAGAPPAAPTTGA
jgi:hypothetical protein